MSNGCIGFEEIVASLAGFNMLPGGFFSRSTFMRIQACLSCKYCMLLPYFAVTGSCFDILGCSTGEDHDGVPTFVLLFKLDISVIDGGPSITAEANLGEEEINRLLLQIIQVGETHGVKFPREFGLLMKQILYFDRYVKILSPELNILNDDRVIIRSDPGMLGL